jgi:hypothetical protein
MTHEFKKKIGSKVFKIPTLVIKLYHKMTNDSERLLLLLLHCYQIFCMIQRPKISELIIVTTTKLLTFYGV